MATVTPPPRLITLNVSGTKITTFRETLTRGSPYFAALLSGKWGDGSLEEEVTPAKQTPEFFLDMDPDLFRMLLNRMRYPEMSFGGAPLLPPGLREAAEFLGMDYETETEKKQTQQQTEFFNISGAELCLRMLERLKIGDSVLVRVKTDDTWSVMNCTNILPFKFRHSVTGQLATRDLENTWIFPSHMSNGYIQPINDASRIEILSREIARKRPPPPNS